MTNLNSRVPKRLSRFLEDCPDLVDDLHRLGCGQEADAFEQAARSALKRLGNNNNDSGETSSTRSES